MMNVSVNHHSRLKTRVRTLQFLVARIRYGSPPQVVGAGMNQTESFLGIQKRKPLKPTQAFSTDDCDRRRNQLLQYAEKRRQFRRSGRKSRQAFRRPKHLVCVPAHTRPPERADLIDNLCRVRSTVCQIAAMHHHVGRHLSQVGENCLEGAKVAVYIRYDCDSHFERSLFGIGLGAARYNINQAEFPF